MKIVIKWEVDDGYAGKSRPQETKLYIERDIMPLEEWNKLTEEEKKEIIREAVQEDFEQKVSFDIGDYGI